MSKLNNPTTIASQDDRVYPLISLVEILGKEKKMSFMTGREFEMEEKDLVVGYETPFGKIENAGDGPFLIINNVLWIFSIIPESTKVKVGETTFK